MAIPVFQTLAEWEATFRGRIKASTLRAEVRSGNIRVFRARASCNAPILISETEMQRWLDEVAGKRQAALSPSEASSIAKEASHVR